MGASVPSEYFVQLYRDSVDPWNFETSEYERAKYDATLDAWPKARYRSACELGCSIGVFTQKLAQRCDRVLAIDVSDAALERARERCKRDKNLLFARVDLLERYPHGWFDLTTICEIGFYFCEADLDRLCRNVIEHSMPGASIMLVHWTPRVSGHATATADVHERFCSDPALLHVLGLERDTYRLDLLERRA